jgi:hypothetical protein
MRRLERVGWTAGISFVSYGTRFGIRANNPAVLEGLLERLPPGWRPARSPIVEDLYSLFVGGSGSDDRKGHRRDSHIVLFLQSTRLARAKDADAVLEFLEHSLHFNVAVKARRHLFVHAGVVGWHDRAIVVPGRSMSGKTTLIEALVKAGAVYYSDEYAVLDMHGRVHPYPKPLSLRGEAEGKRRRVPVESLGGRRGASPLSVGLVAVTRYETGAHWRPTRLSPGQAVLELLNHTLLARSRPQLALETLQQTLAGGAMVLKGKRGEAGETARWLLDFLDARHGTSP